MELLDVALEAGQVAAGIIRDARGTQLDIRHKGTIDMVTQVDLAAEAAIRSVLAAHTPDIPVLAEEGGGAWTATTRWIVDPLDGTTNFVHGYPSYAVSIALEIEGVLEVGCIFDAVNGRPYTARRGHGAHCEGVPLRVSETASLDKALLVTGFPYDRRIHVDRYLRYVRRFLVASQGVRRAGAAAMDFVALAAGQVDGYWEFGLHPWDVAAGVLMVSEAGGTVSDMTGGPLDLEAPRLLASNGKVHGLMTQILAELLSSE
jgi:myo-inositol-1(or 4)-monophosphatase